MKMIRALLIASIGLSFASGVRLRGQSPSASTPVGQRLTVAPEDIGHVRLLPGEEIEIRVVDSPEASGLFRLDQRGMVNVPLIGEVTLLGLTTTEASQVLESSFRTSHMLKTPQVSVDLTQYLNTSVTVLGEVRNPGLLTILVPRPLPDVIALAGGETAIAGREIELVHTEQGRTINRSVPFTRNSSLQSATNVLVFPGDRLIVHRAGIVYVLGAVARPGGYVMQEDGRLDVAQALALAYGPTLQAQNAHCRILRKSTAGSMRELPCGYNQFNKGKTPPPELQPEDIVYVPVSKAKLILSASQTIINTAATAAIYSTY